MRSDAVSRRILPITNQSGREGSNMDWTPLSLFITYTLMFVVGRLMGEWAARNRQRSYARQIKALDEQCQWWAMRYRVAQNGCDDALFWRDEYRDRCQELQLRVIRGDFTNRAPKDLP